MRWNLVNRSYVIYSVNYLSLCREKYVTLSAGP